ncbi:hypothetical protein Prudu_012983, partial [Prunus dulcis]
SSPRPLVLPADLRPPSTIPISGTGANRTSSPAVLPTNTSRGGTGFWPESAIFADCGVQTSSSDFSSFLHQIDRAPGARQNCKRDFRGVEAVDVRGIHHRATHNLSASSQVKRFEDGQNTGETLPNFRQKSKEILKKI